MTKMTTEKIEKKLLCSFLDKLETLLIIALAVGFLSFIFVPIKSKETIFIKNKTVCKNVFGENKYPCKIKGFVKATLMNRILNKYYNSDSDGFIVIEKDKKEYLINRKYLSGIKIISKQ